MVIPKGEAYCICPRERRALFVDDFIDVFSDNNVASPGLAQCKVRPVRFDKPIISLRDWRPISGSILISSSQNNRFHSRCEVACSQSRIPKFEYQRIVPLRPLKVDGEESFIPCIP